MLFLLVSTHAEGLGSSRQIILFSHISSTLPFNLIRAILFYGVVIRTSSYIWIVSVPGFRTSTPSSLSSVSHDASTTSSLPFRLMISTSSVVVSSFVSVEIFIILVVCVVTLRSGRMCLVHTGHFSPTRPRPATTVILPIFFSAKLHFYHHRVVHPSHYMYIILFRWSSLFCAAHIFFRFRFFVFLNAYLETSDCEPWRWPSSTAIAFLLCVYKMKANSLGIFRIFLYLMCRNSYFMSSLRLFQKRFYFSVITISVFYWNLFLPRQSLLFH